MRLYKQWHRLISKRFIKPPYSISRATSIDSECCRLPTTSVLSKKNGKIRSNQFDQQVQVSQGHTLYRNKKKLNTEVHGGGGLELVKPAREPASSRPKPCASLKNPQESCPFAAPCGPRRKKNDDRGQTSAFPSETSRFKPVILAQPSPGSSTIELPFAFAASGAYPPDRELPGSPRQCSLPLACRHPPEGHQIGARKRRAPGNTIILSQPYRRRVSTDRLNREGSQLTASLEGEPGPTPAAKTLPHSYPETRFRRERVRVRCTGVRESIQATFNPPSSLSLNLCMYVCMYVCIVITYSKSMDKPGKVVNPARGQLNKENELFLVPVRA